MLPSGFKVNGLTPSTSTAVPIPPKVKKIIDFLDDLPFSELLTTRELTCQLGMPYGGGTATSHPAVIDHCEKVDGRLYWGNKKTIADLRAKLTEDTNGES